MTEVHRQGVFGRMHTFSKPLLFDEQLEYRLISGGGGGNRTSVSDNKMPDINMLRGYLSGY